MYEHLVERMRKDLEAASEYSLFEVNCTVNNDVNSVEYIIDIWFPPPPMIVLNFTINKDGTVEFSTPNTEE